MPCIELASMMYIQNSLLNSEKDTTSLFTIRFPWLHPQKYQCVSRWCRRGALMIGFLLLSNERIMADDHTRYKDLLRRSRKWYVHCSRYIMINVSFLTNTPYSSSGNTCPCTGWFIRLSFCIIFQVLFSFWICISYLI